MGLVNIGVPLYSIDTETGLIYSHKSNKYLKARPNNHGYARTEIYYNGSRHHIFNHIKVVEFVGDKNGVKIPSFITSLNELKLSIDHLDRDKMNPCRTNLELVTHKENCRRRDACSSLPEL